MEKKIIVCYLLKPVGLQGKIKAKILTDFPERLKKRREYFVGKVENDITGTVVGKATINNGFALFSFEGRDTIEKVEELRDKYLFIKESELARLPKDTVYIYDIIGSAVVDDKSGMEQGWLQDVLKYASGDIYVVLTKDGKEVLIPAIDEFIAEVNTKNKTVVVRRFEEFL